MNLYHYFAIRLLSVFQASEDEIELFNFIIVLFGILLLVIILAYILITSKEE